jgi:hypothetical protein
MTGGRETGGVLGALHCAVTPRASEITITPRLCAADDRLRETIQRARSTVLDCFVASLLANDVKM